MAQAAQSQNARSYLIFTLLAVVYLLSTFQFALPLYLIIMYNNEV